jgi:hypothetical protein
MNPKHSADKYKTAIARHRERVKQSNEAKESAPKDQEGVYKEGVYNIFKEKRRNPF